MRGSAPKLLAALPTLVWLSTAAILSTAPAPGAAQTTADAAICELPQGCKEICQVKARHLRKACLAEDGDLYRCRERARVFKRACLATECSPEPSCEERCKQVGQRLQYRCIENGGDLARCREEAEKAVMSCIEERCRSCACPEIYDPVCGVDGMTYPNACEAECKDVDIRHDGACEPVCLPLPCDVFCEFGHKKGPDGCPTCECNPRPGCRTDADCRDGAVCHQLCSLRPCAEDDRDCQQCVGVCLGQPQPCLCPQVFDPVCGSDGNTYGNSCEARCARVDVKEAGACESTL